MINYCKNYIVSLLYIYKTKQKMKCQSIFLQENAESNGVFENLLAQVSCVHIPNCGYVPR